MDKHKTVINLLRELGFYGGGIILLAYLHQKPIILTVLILIFCLVQLTIFRQKNDLYFFFAGFILGPIVDLVAIPFGIWEYSNSFSNGLPLWLPLALGMMTVLLKRISESASNLNK
jgi:hypothetical protein